MLNWKHWMDSWHVAEQLETWDATIWIKCHTIRNIPCILFPFHSRSIQLVLRRLRWFLYAEMEAFQMVIKATTGQNNFHAILTMLSKKKSEQKNSANHNRNVKLRGKWQNNNHFDVNYRFISDFEEIARMVFLPSRFNVIRWYFSATLNISLVSATIRCKMFKKKRRTLYNKCGIVYSIFNLPLLNQIHPNNIYRTNVIVKLEAILPRLLEITRQISWTKCMATAKCS